MSCDLLKIPAATLRAKTKGQFPDIVTIALWYPGHGVQGTIASQLLGGLCQSLAPMQTAVQSHSCLGFQ